MRFHFILILTGIIVFLPLNGFEHHHVFAVSERYPNDSDSAVSVIPFDVSLRRELDLTPSYTSYLPYSQVCGVVVCQSDRPLNEMETIINEMDQLQHDLEKYLAIPPAKEKIELCIFSSEKSYLKFLVKEFADAPRDRRALYVKKEGPGIVLLQKTRDFEIDLRHEMTHAVLHASLEYVPIWLDEGLAKYFEPSPSDRAFSNPYLSRLQRSNMFGLIPSLDRLEKLVDIGDMDNREYLESWAWTHFFIHYSSDTHQILADYLQILAERPPDAARMNQGKQVNQPKIGPLLRQTMKNPRSAFYQHYRQWGKQNRVGFQEGLFRK
ncbi:MAG: hypothetical protein ACRC10_00765 [Thermoguttaceae bacterium]